MKLSVCLVLGLASAVAVTSCSKKSKTEESAGNDAISGALAIGYPEGLSVPAFPQTTAAAFADSALNLADTADAGETLAQKAEQAKKVLNGEVEDCFANLKTRAARQLPQIDTCYEFDQEMIHGYNGGVDKLKGTKDGLSKKTGSTEVCMVSFARDEMKEIEAMIDQALDRAQAMACLGRKNGKNAPANVNDVVDLKDVVTARTNSDDKAPKFSEVTLKRLADKDSRPVFETKISTSKTLPDGSTQGDEVTIIHSPASGTDNNTYNGVIKIKRTGGQSNDPNAKNMIGALSINYARSSEGDVKKIKASVRRARFKTSYANLFDADGNVNFADLAQDAKNEDVNGIGMVEFDLNQTDGTGSLSYWRNPGGSYGESARGFVFKTEKDDAGVLKGCAISGAVIGTSIRKSLSESIELKPSGWYHPFFNLKKKPDGTLDETNISDADYTHGVSRLNPPGCTTGTAGCTTQVGRWNKPDLGADKAALAEQYVVDQFGNYVTRQCFKQDATTGAYALDNSEIAGAAGYELIETTSTKFIAPPDLKAVRERKVQ